MAQHLMFDKNLNFVLERLEHQSNFPLKWFQDNSMKMIW